MVKYELDEDIVGLARLLALIIVLLLAVAVLFDFLSTVLADGYQFEFEIHGLISRLGFFFASFTALYGLLLILSKDDSNFMRVVSIFYILSLLLAVVSVL